MKRTRTDPPKASAAPKPTRKPVRKDGRVKVSLLLAPAVDERLSLVAVKRRCDRSQLADYLLGRALDRFAASEEDGEETTH